MSREAMEETRPNGAAQSKPERSMTLDLRKAIVLADGSHLQRVERPRFDWAHETVQVQDTVATNQGPMPIMRALVTGRMVISRIRDDELAAKLAAGVISEPPEGTTVDRWMVPVLETEERQIGLVVEKKSEIIQAKRSPLILSGQS